MLSLLLPLLASATPAAPELIVPRYGTAEIVLHAAQPYNGASGNPNPFTTVTFELQVTTPSGRSIPVEGFFNGDGNGGALGDVFVARIYADEFGTWSWTASSSDAGLNGQSGSFTVSGTLPGRWRHGGLVARPATPRHLSHQDGTPFFAAGKMLDLAIGGTTVPIGQTLPMFSEVWTNTNRRDLLDRAAALSANKLAVYLANQGDFSAQWPTTPWVGNSSTNDKTRRPGLKMYDQWTVTMRDEGFGAQFYFADNLLRSLPRRPAASQPLRHGTPVRLRQHLFHRDAGVGRGLDGVWMPRRSTCTGRIRGSGRFRPPSPFCSTPDRAGRLHADPERQRKPTPPCTRATCRAAPRR
jgi:hypothetical protein